MASNIILCVNIPLVGRERKRTEKALLLLNPLGQEATRMIPSQELVTLSHLDARERGGWEMWAQASPATGLRYGMAFAIFATAKHGG